jgi:histidine ammonia-lyase
MATITNPTLVIDGQSLNCTALNAAMRNGSAIRLNETAWTRIRDSRQLVEEVIRTGIPAYGITTGVGSQKSQTLSAKNQMQFGSRLIKAHATRVPGPTLPNHRVRGALIVLLSQFSSGFSGISEDLGRLLVDAINSNAMPSIDACGSVSASDLVPLAQIANWLMSRPMAAELQLPKAGEGLSLINCNAITLATGADVLIKAQQLLQVFDLAACIALEGFRGNLDSISEHVNSVHKRVGQARAASNMRKHLANSKLWNSGEARYLQDPLSFRCASQVHGAAREVLDSSLAIWDTELNSINDNPITDLDANVLRSHGNMDTTRLTLAIDSMLQSYAKIVDLISERLHKQQWTEFSGLPTGLAAEASAIGGVQFLNLGHIAASLIASARICAQPHLLASVGQLADGVEDTAGLTLHAIYDLERLLDVSWKIVSVEIAISVWAIYRRGISTDDLGADIKSVYNMILPLLPVDAEGEDVFDLAPLINAVRSMPA